jgi:hypothetical protein
VSEQAAAFRRKGMLPSTQQKQARPAMVARQWDVQEVAELVRKSQVMEGVLRDVMTTGHAGKRQGATMKWLR